MSSEEKDFLSALAKAKAVAARLSAEAKAAGALLAESSGSSYQSHQSQQPISTGKRDRDDEYSSYDRRREDSYSDSKRRSTDDRSSQRPRYGLGSSERERGSDRDRGSDPYSSNGGYGGRPSSLRQSSEITIPSSMVGLVIGKGGENMKRIEKETGVKIQFSQDQPPSDPERRTTIMGSEDGIKLARKMIFEIVDGTSKRPQDVPGSRDEPSRTSGPTGHYGPRPTSSIPSGSSTSPMEVPSSKVGLVIGRMGETIKTLQEKSGAKIAVVPDTDSRGGATRLVNITGSPDTIEKAKGLIQELLNGSSKPYGGNSGGFESGDFEELKIPNDRVGLVIGKGGEAIKSIQSMFSVRVVIEQAPNLNNERSIKVYGQRDDILRAVEAILEKTMRTKGGGGGGQQQSNYGYGGSSYGNDSHANAAYAQQDYAAQGQYWDPSAYNYDASAYYGQAAQAAQAQGQGQEQSAEDAAANAKAWEAYYQYYSQYGATGDAGQASGQAQG
ncbi:Far upstream element-binding protein 1 [Dinochytrium kinnereticum]|nr:Far upstream element-binding protein 1 [Dinochytrium kinnereticum]